MVNMKTTKCPTCGGIVFKLAGKMAKLCHDECIKCREKREAHEEWLANDARQALREMADMRLEHEAILAEMKAAAGYLRNAKIDLETGATKATAIRTIEGGLKRLEAAIAKATA